MYSSPCGIVNKVSPAVWERNVQAALRVRGAWLMCSVRPQAFAYAFPPEGDAEKTILFGRKNK